MSSRKVLAIQARKRRPKGKKDKAAHHRRLADGLFMRLTPCFSGLPVCVESEVAIGNLSPLGATGQRVP
ncbi:hypothetical protein AGOR_G00251560 [Albula goreensis]|uniref:Uncharacterized protein n=1 Tax=Albula goreensis TaxID=1534307 RepID=A0A8T3CCJ3_9TELE|nr:hypothetical protein AGOR_G00251560 [Albula goreensis]